MSTNISGETFKPIVLMNRTDGLGERLCALINTIRLADALGTDFKFHWTADIWNPVYHLISEKQKNTVLGQSIASQEEIFSEEFIKKYELDTYHAKKFRSCPQGPMTLAKFRQDQENHEFEGWTPSQRFLENDCDPEFLKTIQKSSADAFRTIGFTPEIENLIFRAAEEKIEEFDAVHLRSGDMVFGEVRKWGQWSNKVLNPSVTRHLIHDIKKKGRSVVLFGQDVDGLTKMAAELNCHFVGNMIPEDAKTPTQRAIFEIMLMSRAKTIYAGYSGFSRAACMIANIRAKTPNRLYDTQDYVDITLNDLGRDGNTDHPLSKAYGYWQVFDLGRQYFSLPQQLRFMQKAAQYDPENLLYTVNASALLYRLGRDQDAEMLITDCDKKSGDGAFVAQLIYKYYSTDYTHRDQFNDFHGAARRGQNRKAKLCSAAIYSALKK